MSADGGLGFTRARDLAVVALVAAVAGLLVVSASYRSLPTLPRLAGLPAVVLGVALALWGLGLRRRLRDRAADDPSRVPRRPVDPLVAARSLVTAKATSLAGAALAGLWVGLLVHVAPRSGQVTAAASDTVTGAIGVVGAAVMVGGALFLEHCCRTPDPRP